VLSLSVELSFDVGELCTQLTTNLDASPVEFSELVLEPWQVDCIEAMAKMRESELPHRLVSLWGVRQCEDRLCQPKGGDDIVVTGTDDDLDVAHLFHEAVEVLGWLSDEAVQTQFGLT
jgi:hypothetical protein